MKAVLFFALLAACALAAGYMSVSGGVAGALASDYSDTLLNNPFKIMIVLGATPFAWFTCSWNMLFGGSYPNCFYTTIFYALQ